jgi:NAD(P)-dependent dehydrogenase (short-subunit alcohol dehydrogenase family)
MTGSSSDAPILITGVGREGQVGEVVARRLGEGGSTLLLVDRTEDQARDRAATLTRSGVRAFAFGCDLADEARVGELAARLRREHGDRLRALVHLAGGFSLGGGVSDGDPGVWQRMITINLTTAYLVTRAFLPLLRPARGAIVYFASEAALPGGKVANIAGYAAAKSGVATLMRAVAQEERANGVRANALAPASIRTAANMQAMGENVRYVEREEVADAVAFLCGDAAAAVTGQTTALS